MEKMKTTLYLPKELWMKVKKRAIDEGTTATKIVENALKLYTLKEGEKNERN